MKAIFKTSIISILLLACLLLSSCAVPNFDYIYEIIGNEQESNEPNEDVTDVPLDGSAPSTDSGGSSDTGSNDSLESTPIPDDTEDNFALKLGEGRLTGLDYIPHNTDGIAKIGFAIDDLKANTKYRMNWTISSGFSINTDAYFATFEKDGVMVPYITIATDYQPNTTLGDRYTSTSGSPDLLYNGNDGNGIEFTTAGEGAMLFINFFESPYESQEQMTALRNDLLPYITSLTFTEIG